MGAALQADGETRSVVTASSIRGRSAAWTILLDWMLKGFGADSEEKHEPVSDIDTAVVDRLKVLDPKRPIGEADIRSMAAFMGAHLGALGR